ncbi:sialidase [Purpureocillium lavendulum]|uniref:Sialidase n=1 Tax=Purpureocillium lavendulum TaxID=1247861 RepID=A0AB34G215_9HYPO|nr:sialidase [Purpureocillium lavendulum]
MSALEADVAFDFTFPSPSTPPPPSYGFTLDGAFTFDPAFLEIPYGHHEHRHARSASQASSIYSAVSTVESTPDSVCTRLTTPPRASPPVVRHGPLLLPKIRPQDQNLDIAHIPAAKVNARRVKKAQTTPPPRLRATSAKPARSSHARSYTNPETLTSMAYAHMSSLAGTPVNAAAHHVGASDPAPLLCSPASFAQNGTLSSEPDLMTSGMCSELPSRGASTSFSVDAAVIDQYGYPTYRRMPFSSVTADSMTSQTDCGFSSYAPRDSSPLALAASLNETATPSTTLINFLTAPNPAASLVRNISFPLRDPSIRYFWWDVRSVRSWNSFNAAAVMSLPGARALLTTPVPAPVLSQPSMTARHPETEAALHGIYASFYLPKLNAALAISSNRALQMSVPAKAANGVNDLLFLVNAAGESATAATMFGGKPSARVVGLVRSFDRFNTGMRVEGNIKRVEYLRGLSAIHHAMREHGCRYGFILTEIELVVVRAGTESTPFFGDLEIASVQLAASNPEGDTTSAPSEDTPQALTACLALWGLCQLVGDKMPAGHPHWRAEIGAPAEGTRRKARARDNWMPQPQLAEKREAKRSRGWVWPEDAIGRKEMGKRGVKYGNF